MSEESSHSSDWAALRSVYNSAFFCGLGFFVVNFLIPIIAYGFMDASAIEVALVFSMLTLGSAIFSPVAGKVAKRGRRRTAIFLGATARAMAYVGMAISVLLGNKYILIANSLLWGFGTGFYTVGSNAEISERVLHVNRAEAFGKREAAHGRGSVMGALVGFNIIFSSPEWGIIAVFALFAAANLIGGTIVIMDRRPSETTTKVSMSFSLREAAGTGIATLILAAAIDMFITSLLSPFVELFVIERFTGDLMQIALIYLPGGVLAGVFGGALGRFADRKSKVRIVSAAVIVGACSTFSLVVVPAVLAWPINLISIAVLFSIGSITGIMAYSTLSSIFGTAYEGRAEEGFGVFEAAMSLSRFSAPLIGGILWDFIDPSAPFIVAGFSGFILVPIYVYGMKQYERAAAETLRKGKDVL